jgi:hypothetical protein
MIRKLGGTYLCERHRPPRLGGRQKGDEGFDRGDIRGRVLGVDLKRLRSRIARAQMVRPFALEAVARPLAGWWGCQKTTKKKKKSTKR